MILAKEVQKQSYVAGFEGVPFLSLRRMSTLVENLSLNPTLTGCATSGNPEEHLEYAIKAHESGNNVYIIGYSAGAKDALAFAELCKKEEVLIQTMYLLDPTCFDGLFKQKITKNVLRVINYRSIAENSIRGNPITKDNLESKATSFKNKEVLKVGHLKLPNYIMESIEKDILWSER